MDVRAHRLSVAGPAAVVFVLLAAVATGTTPRPAPARRPPVQPVICIDLVKPVICMDLANPREKK